MLHKQNQRYFILWLLISICIIAGLILYISNENREFREYEERCRYQAMFLEKYMEATIFVEGQLINGIIPTSEKENIKNDIRYPEQLIHTIESDDYTRNILELNKIMKEGIESGVFSEENGVLSAREMQKGLIQDMILLKIITDCYMDREMTEFDQISLQGEVLKFEEIYLDEEQVNKYIHLSKGEMDCQFVEACKGMLFQRVLLDGYVENYEKVKDNKKLLKENMPFPWR